VPHTPHPKVWKPRFDESRLQRLNTAYTNAHLDVNITCCAIWNRVLSISAAMGDAKLKDLALQICSKISKEHHNEI
jgi:hypothetical protein